MGDISYKILRHLECWKTLENIVSSHAWLACDPFGHLEARPHVKPVFEATAGNSFTAKRKWYSNTVGRKVKL